MGRELLEQQLKYAKPDLLVNMRSPIEHGKKGKKNDVDFLTTGYFREAFDGKVPLYFDAQITTYSGIIP